MSGVSVGVGWEGEVRVCVGGVCGGGLVVCGWVGVECEREKKTNRKTQENTVKNKCHKKNEKKV